VTFWLPSAEARMMKPPVLMSAVRRPTDLWSLSPS
jgi:hypothetical protein